MTQNKSDLLRWFHTENYRAKAQLKYELKHLESRLHAYLEIHHDDVSCQEEMSTLCSVIAHKYLDYLKLIDADNLFMLDKIKHEINSLNWIEQCHIIADLKQQLVKTADWKEESRLIREIASLYYQCSCLTHLHPVFDTIESSDEHDELKQLFKQDNFKGWLPMLVAYWNQRDIQNTDPLPLFRHWCDAPLKSALNFFSEPEVVNLVNAVFFYKLYPDKLFNELIHPEKLVSVRMRLGLLHEFIEMLQQQLHHVVFQQELKSGIDFLFHGDELPKGIMIEEHEEFREIIQSAVKHLRVTFTPEKEEQATIERLHDLGRAYKYWFNPNRLIDAVMVLLQRLVKVESCGESNYSLFHDEMLILYQQLTTTECLDLYGYFANKDSRYLLYTLFSIDQGIVLDWLPSLTQSEKNAVGRVFRALQCVMEALRVELKNRHVTTEAYEYDLGKPYLNARSRNREAVLRLIVIYGGETISINDSVEKLFEFIEEKN